HDSDRFGNLAADGGLLFDELSKIGGGVAIAMALENPDLVSPLALAFGPQPKSPAWAAFAPELRPQPTVHRAKNKTGANSAAHAEFAPVVQSCAKSKFVVGPSSHPIPLLHRHRPVVHAGQHFAGIAG